jgi:hypothetical protein
MKYGWIFLLAACGRYGFTDHATVDASADGSGAAATRLKLMYEVFDGTLREPIDTPFDSTFGVPCYLYDTPSGTRCLPSGFATPMYLDSACTQPIATKPAADAQYAFDAEYPPVTHAYTFGASVGVPATVYGKLFDGSCAVGSSMSTTEYFALDEIPFDRFARLQLQRGGEGRLVTQSYVSDDGFRMSSALHDTVIDADCVGDALDDGTLCFPYDTDVVQFYSDSACTHGVEDAYVPVKFAMNLSATPVCTVAAVSVQPVTTPLVSTTPVWLEITGSANCVPASAGAGRRLYDLGAPVALASVTRQPRPGGRIQPIQDIANGAVADETNVLWDSQLGIECRPSTAADGVLRCVPKELYGASSYYTDAACTQQVTAVGVQAPACASYSLPYVADYNAGGPGPRFFHATRVTGMTHQGGPGNCLAQPGVDMYVETGPEVPASTFATVTQATDP